MIYTNHHLHQTIFYTKLPFTPHHVLQQITICTTPRLTPNHQLHQIMIYINHHLLQSSFHTKPPFTPHHGLHQPPSTSNPNIYQISCSSNPSKPPVNQTTTLYTNHTEPHSIPTTIYGTFTPTTVYAKLQFTRTIIYNTPPLTPNHR